MSNRRRLKPTQREQNTVGETSDTVKFLRSIEGIPLPNGCPDCSATQTVRAGSGGEWRVKVMHSDSCPALPGVLDQYGEEIAMPPGNSFRTSVFPPDWGSPPRPPYSEERADWIRKQVKTTWSRSGIAAWQPLTAGCSRSCERLS